MAVNSSSLVLLDESSCEDAFVLTNDGDKFFLAVTDAARACRAYEKGKLFGEQFQELLQLLSQWVASNRGRIQSAHLMPRDSDILFLVTQKAAPFDADLAESLTDLDLQIANSDNFNLVDLEVLAIPPVCESSRAAFLSSGEVLNYAK